MIKVVIGKSGLRKIDRKKFSATFSIDTNTKYVVICSK